MHPKKTSATSILQREIEAYIEARKCKHDHEIESKTRTPINIIQETIFCE